MTFRSPWQTIQSNKSNCRTYGSNEFFGCFLSWILVMFVWYFPATIVTNWTKGSRKFQRIYYHVMVLFVQKNVTASMEFSTWFTNLQKIHQKFTFAHKQCRSFFSPPDSLWINYYEVMRTGQRTIWILHFKCFFSLFRRQSACTNISFRSFYVAFFSSTYLYTLKLFSQAFCCLLFQ